MIADTESGSGRPEGRGVFGRLFLPRDGAARYAATLFLPASVRGRTAGGPAVLVRWPQTLQQGGAGQRGTPPATTKVDS